MDFIGFVFAMFLGYWIISNMLASFLNATAVNKTSGILLLVWSVFLCITWVSIGDGKDLGLSALDNDSQIILILGVLWGMWLVSFDSWLREKFGNDNIIIKWLFNKTESFLIKNIAMKGVWGYEYQKRRAKFTKKGKQIEGWVIKESTNTYLVKDDTTGAEVYASKRRASEIGLELTNG